MPNPNIILIAAVVYITFLGGYLSGSVSVLLTLGYSLVFFSNPGNVLSYTPDNFKRIIVSFIFIPIMMLIVGRLKKDHRKKTRELERLNEELSQEHRKLIERELMLKLERELLDTTLSSIGVAVIVTDPTGMITLLNPLAEKYTDRTEQEARGKDYRDVFQNVNFLSREEEVDPVKQVIKTEAGIEASRFEGLITKDGTLIRIAGNAVGIKSDNGQISGVVMSFKDMSKEYELEKEIEAFQELNLEMVCIVGKDGNFTSVNKRFEDVLGYKKEDLEGKPFLSYIYEEDIPATLEAHCKVRGNKSVDGFTSRYRCKDGAHKFIEWHIRPGVGGYLYFSARDITEKRLLEERLRASAIRDGLTGLYNRNIFETMIGEIMEHSDRYEEPLTFILVDLDHFKKVNDTWGHPVGDDILKSTAATLTNLVRDSDLLIRLGGEEFAVVMQKTSLEGAAVVAEKIRVTMESKQNPIVGRQTVSVGVAERMNVESFSHWYRRTDEALYRAKNNGRNRVEASDGKEKLSLTSSHLEWRTEWETGNTDLDTQHQEMLKMAGELIEASLAGRRPQEIRSQLETLLNQVVRHFEDEERVLKEMAYPDQVIHAAEHTRLTSKVLRLKEEYLGGKVKPASFFSFVIDDLIIGHLVEFDAKYFPYIRKVENS